MLGADIHWGRRHNLATVIFRPLKPLKPHPTFHMLYGIKHSICFSSKQEPLAEWSARQEPINQPVATIWGLVVRSTFREFREEMVRSQLIIVTNSTQMQERLLTEPDTCPCRLSLLSAHSLAQDSCAGTLGQGQMMAQPARA